MTETQPDRQDGDGLLRSALELKITDSKGHEVAEDSLHELRKAVRSYLRATRDAAEGATEENPFLDDAIRWVTTSGTAATPKPAPDAMREATPEQLAAAERGMAGLEAQSDIWAEEVRLVDQVKAMGDVSRGLTDRMPADVRNGFIDRQEAQIDAIARQAYIEGFYRGGESRKDYDEARTLSAPVPSPDGAFRIESDVDAEGFMTNTRLVPVPPSATGAAEPVAWRWRTLPKFSEDAADQEWSLESNVPAFINPHHHEVEPLYATPPVRGDREEGVVWRRVNGEPFEYAIQQGQHGDEFVKLLSGSCLRRPVQPGAGEREAELLRTATRLRDMLTADGDPPSIFVPQDIADAGDANEFTQAFDKLATAVRAYRQAPQSSREG